MNKKYAEVVFNIPLNKAFHYAIPHHMQGGLQPGHRVLAPFGNRLISGYCVGFSQEAEVPADKVKELRDKGSFWNAQSERANAEVLRLREKYEE